MFCGALLRDAGVERAFRTSALQSDIDSTGREAVGSEQWIVRSSDRSSSRCMCGLAVVLMRSDRCELRRTLRNHLYGKP